eukprot:jgi/Bigna1/135128/aug1.28_g9836
MGGVSCTKRSCCSVSSKVLLDEDADSESLSAVMGSEQTNEQEVDVFDDGTTQGGASDGEDHLRSSEEPFPVAPEQRNSTRDPLRLDIEEILVDDNVEPSNHTNAVKRATISGEAPGQSIHDSPVRKDRTSTCSTESKKGPYLPVDVTVNDIELADDGNNCNQNVNFSPKDRRHWVEEMVATPQSIHTPTMEGNLSVEIALDEPVNMRCLETPPRHTPDFGTNPAALNFSSPIVKWPGDSIRRPVKNEQRVNRKLGAVFQTFPFAAAVPSPRAYNSAQNPLTIDVAEGESS